MMWVVLIISILSIVSGWLMYWRHPVITSAGKKPGSARVSLVIPARNEEKNLPILLQSLRSQTLQPFEVIVADDGSTDKTVEAARQFGAEVVSVNKEQGWKGKTAGCWQGAEAAGGDWLLFLDADTCFADSTALERLMETYLKHQGEGMLSIQPYHAIQKGYENFSVLFNILAMAGMNVFSVIKSCLGESGAFGPALLCSSEDYFQAGGHRAAKESLIEGFALADAFWKNGLPVHLYGGKGAVHFRMYPEGLRQLMDGWTKHFASGAQQTHPLVMTWVSLWIAGGFVIPSFLALSLVQLNGVGLAVLVYVVYAGQFFVFARRTGNFRWWTALLFPAVFLFFIGVFTRSWAATHIFKSVNWKGQKIDL